MDSVPAADPAQLSMEPVPLAAWPASCPHPDENCTLSISCGNTCLSFCLHKSMADNFEPDVIWR